MERTALREKYPVLYNMARRKSDTVANALSSNLPNIIFRRAIVGNKLDAWMDLASCKNRAYTVNGFTRHLNGDSNTEWSVISKIYLWCLPCK
jgi:hypothetical protein